MDSRKISKRDFIKSNLLGAGSILLGLNNWELFKSSEFKTQEPKFYVDIHSHPTLKPIGKSSTQSNSINPNDKNSIWHYGKKGFIEKAINLALGFADYPQSNLTEAIKGNVRIAGVSLYSPEIKFFDNKIGQHFLGNEFENFVSQFGEKRIKKIESQTYDYFEDLEEQYQYLLQCNGSEVLINNQKYRYLLVKNYSEMVDALNDDGCTTIAITLNIEGGHSFGPGKNPENQSYSSQKVIENVEKVKKWTYRPLYVTLAHHFYNELCGHTRSIPEELEKILNQTYGLNSGFTDTGKEVLDLLLDNTNNDRILIDVKHFSIESRKYYYNLLDTKYKNENLPIIFSHGGVNGLKSFDYSGNHIPGTVLNEWDISLFDDEVIRIARSNGIIGLNFDKRVMASNLLLKTIPVTFENSYMLSRWSIIIWNNIAHIAEICDKNGLPAWDTACLGTDFDGIINPIDGFWTFEELPLFEKELLLHARNYMKTTNISISNRIEPEEIVIKIMQQNALNFYKRTLT